MPDLGVWEIIIIAVVIVILFGSKKLPDASRAIGRSMRIFKSETKGLRDDEKDDDKHAKDEERPAQKEPQQLPVSSSSGDGTTVNGESMSTSEQAPESADRR
ncbi:MAG: Sec-independent protein translocase subunit TatA [Streptosporangiaceae bacterium]